MIGEMVRVNTWLSQACVKLVVIIKSEVRYLNSESQSYQIFMLQTKVNFVLSVYFGLLYIKNKAQVVMCQCHALLAFTIQNVNNKNLSNFLDNINMHDKLLLLFSRVTVFFL